MFLHFPKEFRELNEYEAKSMLNKLGLPDYEQKVGTLSGGQRKRVALAAALMIYALVWGDEAASRTFRASILRAVVVCSLGFYCLAKSYSFYTGANHLHSIISPGTPGRILSAGLILPLNVAVGFVVCCTMYSLYMYFRRGEL